MTDPSNALVDRLERVSRGPGYLTPPPGGDLVHHVRWHAGDNRMGQLADNASGSPMVWRGAPYLVQHPGGNGRALALPTADEPNSSSGKAGTCMDILRLAVAGERVVRWGLLWGHHAHWGAAFGRTFDFFLDHCDAAGQRTEAKVRFELYSTTAGAVVNRWQILDATDTYVNVPGMAEADGLMNGGLTSRNEGKAGYNILEIDFDYVSKRFLSVRINDQCFGRRRGPDHPSYNALYNLGPAPTKPLTSFRYGKNYCVQINNRNDSTPSSGGVYRGRQTMYLGEEYVSVLSYTDDRKAWA